MGVISSGEATTDSWLLRPGSWQAPGSQTSSSHIKGAACSTGRPTLSICPGPATRCWGHRELFLRRPRAQVSNERSPLSLLDFMLLEELRVVESR